MWRTHTKTPGRGWRGARRGTGGSCWLSRTAVRVRFGPVAVARQGAAGSAVWQPRLAAPSGRTWIDRLRSAPPNQSMGVKVMAFSMYDASVPICAQQLGAMAVIAGKAAEHCATNKIEESALLTDRLYPDMFCLARQFRQATDFGRTTPGRLAGVAGPEFAAVDDTSFAAAKKRCEDSLAFVNSLTRAQIEGSEDKV